MAALAARRTGVLLLACLCWRGSASNWAALHWPLPGRVCIELEVRCASFRWSGSASSWDRAAANRRWFVFAGLVRVHKWSQCYALAWTGLLTWASVTLFQMSLFPVELCGAPVARGEVSLASTIFFPAAAISRRHGTEIVDQVL